MFALHEYAAAEAIAFTSSDEQALLCRLAEAYAASTGIIIDGGAFLGASTSSLARGLDLAQVSRSKRIVAIDRFAVQDPYIHAKLVASGIRVSLGDSILELYLHNTRPHHHYIETRAGDVMQVGRVYGPVDIAFIDISKSKAINAFIALEWFKHLLPGHSSVIQQDFHSPAFPWIAVSMGVAADCFSITHAKVGETAVFRLEKPLSSSLLSRMASVAPIGHDALRALHALMEHFPAAERHTLALIECQVLAQMGSITMARANLEGLIDSGPYADTKWPQWTARVQGVIEAAEHGAQWASSQR